MLMRSADYTTNPLSLQEDDRGRNNTRLDSDGRP